MGNERHEMEEGKTRIPWISSNSAKGYKNEIEWSQWESGKKKDPIQASMTLSNRQSLALLPSHVLSHGNGDKRAVVSFSFITFWMNQLCSSIRSIYRQVICWVHRWMTDNWLPVSRSCLISLTSCVTSNVLQPGKKLKMPASDSRITLVFDRRGVI